ncbi:aspartic peptidase domain-containing protein [Mycena belliarum]|uniref:Aspartic peptidase domain-containing protein n=1 Tax=Mycena belliarum TaxID=1033014 RepID=A0AAD6TQ61_9AGAR|nr:aspartic peptidase domain-containing protein [Mycena belliae]
MHPYVWVLPSQIYGINVNLSGAALTLVIDTGSTDMFILHPTSPLGPFNETAAVAALGYADGTGANGTVGLAKLEISGYTVPFQAFVNGTSGDDFSPFSGLIGLGFDDPSDPIPSALTAAGLNSSKIGKSVLSNIFDQNPETPRFFAVSLSRDGDKGGTADGDLTIGGYDPRYADVQHAPLLPLFGTGSWNILMDGIFLNGAQIPWARDPKGNIPEGKVRGLLDTGTTGLIVPPDIFDAIYSSYPGAVRTSPNATADGLKGAWIVPCNATIDLHLTFSHQNFTVHPLDLSDIQVFTTTSDNKSFTVCTPALGESDAWGRDAILGQSFLRNVYTVFGFGNATTGPYAQLLSLVDESTAVADFMAVRSPLLASGQAPELSPAAFARLVAPDQKPSMESASSSPSASSTSTPSSSLSSSSTSISASDKSTASSSSSSSASSSPTSSSSLSPSSASTSSSNSAVPDPTSTRTADTHEGNNLAQIDLAADAPSAPSDSRITKYAPVVIGLLGANLAILLFLLVLGVVHMVRKGRDAGGQGGRDVRYTRVELKDEAF